MEVRQRLADIDHHGPLSFARGLRTLLRIGGRYDQSLLFSFYLLAFGKNASYSFESKQWMLVRSDLYSFCFNQNLRGALKVPSLSKQQRNKNTISFATRSVVKK